MNKKLIVALCIAVILLAAAVGTVIYLENRGEQVNPPASVPEDNTGAAQETGEATQETTEVPTEVTVAISLPTEDPEEVSPEETFVEEDEVPPVTGEPLDPDATEDRESNETPEDEF